MTTKVALGGGGGGWFYRFHGGAPRQTCIRFIIGPRKYDHIWSIRDIPWVS